MAADGGMGWWLAGGGPVVAEKRPSTVEAWVAAASVEGRWRKK